jgi:hypothetical protein
MAATTFFTGDSIPRRARVRAGLQAGIFGLLALRIGKAALAGHVDRVPALTIF